MESVEEEEAEAGNLDWSWGSGSTEKEAPWDQTYFFFLISARLELSNCLPEKRRKKKGVLILKQVFFKAQVSVLMSSQPAVLFSF